MITRYATDKLTFAIRSRLIGVYAVPPTCEPTHLASEIREVLLG